MSQSLYCGVPVYFRIERRKEGNVVILSFRRNQDGKFITEYEHPPRRIPELEILLAQPGTLPDARESPDKPSLLEQLPEKTMEDFFRRFLSTDGSPEVRALGVNRRKTMQDLTLGALLAADKEYLLHEKPDCRTGRTKARAQSSIEDDLRTIQVLRQQEGTTRWRDVTPEHCSHWLKTKSKHMRSSCKRVMRNLLLPLFEMGAIDSLLGWEDFDPEGVDRPILNYANLVRQNLLPTMLSYGQCRQLLQGIVTPDGPGRVTGVDMALLLNLTLGIPEEELCALNLNDFSTLNDFKDRLTVDISKRYDGQAGQSNHRLRPLQDRYQRRKLPLSCLAGQCFRDLRSRRKKADASPLVPSKTNARQHMKPSDLKKEFDKRLSTLKLPSGLGDVNLKSPEHRRLMAATAERELRKSGCEDEELRYLQGKPPLTVSAKSYADFLNEAELNKLGALQDRWLNKVVPVCQRANTALRLSKRGATTQWSASTPECSTQVTIHIPFEPKDLESIPDEGLTLEVSALHGFSGAILLT